MPYVTHERRTAILNNIQKIEFAGPGDLNYALTLLALDYIEHRQTVDTDGALRYQTINDVIGALEACKLEFYRRMVGPFEDRKIQENGDVYP